MDTQAAENLLVRMGFNGTEYCVTEEVIEGDNRLLTGWINSMEGEVDRNVTFTIPVDATEVRLYGAPGVWELREENSKRVWHQR